MADAIRLAETQIMAVLQRTSRARQTITVPECNTPLPKANGVSFKENGRVTGPAALNLDPKRTGLSFGCG